MLDQRLDSLEPKANLLFVSHSRPGRTALTSSNFLCRTHQNPDQLTEAAHPAHYTVLAKAQPPCTQTFSFGYFDTSREMGIRV